MRDLRAASFPSLYIALNLTILKFKQEKSKHKYNFSVS